MERFLNVCDNEAKLIKKEEILEEMDLVTIIDPKANHENMELLLVMIFRMGTRLKRKDSILE